MIINQKLFWSLFIKNISKVLNDFETQFTATTTSSEPTTTEATTVEPTTNSFPGFTEPYDPNEEIEEENEENNEDNDGDGESDNQYSGLSCWMCDAPNFEECAKVGKEMKCKSNQVNKKLSFKNLSLNRF